MPKPVTIADVQRALAGARPGPVAQGRMAPQPRVGQETYFNPPPNCRQGSVLILLYPRAGQLHLVLTRRTDRVRHHKGQVSLPGGAQLPGEPLVQTALREAGEELGIPTRDIQVLGGLTPLYVPVSGYCIHPFVGFLAVAPLLRPDPIEVAEVLEVTLDELLDPAARHVELWKDPQLSSRRIPCFHLRGWVVWGATAMILSELSAMLEAENAAADGCSCI
jgi:8-oxo-dGTP pyrophosphatase MutT (NUDIX family)